MTCAVKTSVVNMVEMTEEQSPTAAFPLSETHFPPTRFSEANRHHVWKRTGLTTATAPQMRFFSRMSRYPLRLKTNSQLQQHLFPSAGVGVEAPNDDAAHNLFTRNVMPASEVNNEHNKQ